jgi:UDP-GlcNAc:undecaprenyl-phosphate GlcNAc-1-phosphate transferase
MMGSAASSSVGLVAIAGCAAAAAILVLSRLAPRLGLVDAPGGRKAHAHEVPLVGGLAVFAALLLAAHAAGIAPQSSVFLVALSLVLAIGLWDDVAEIAPWLKIAIQVAACAVMIWGARVELHGVGDLLGWKPIGMSFLVVPITIFATVGVVNSINMMDGIDGLAGSVAFVAFAWYTAIAAGSGLEVQSRTSLILCGALAGFLVFNLRLPWQPRARAFLGDAGSLMLGFALAWFAIDLTQGTGRTLQPIAALWVLLLPLADCVSLMARRLKAGRSPFVADAHHIHHYLLARGLTHGQTLVTLVALSTLFGAVGYAGWRFALPEALLFWPFFFGFFAYHAWIQRAWKGVEERGEATTPPLQDERRAISLG